MATVVQTRPRILIQRWRGGHPAPNKAMEDLVSFSNWIAYGRMLGPKRVRGMMRASRVSVRPDS
ncbi:hypothetical protein CG724_09625 [Streptomyces sp. CB02120-2]|nr:hypothetical protein CG724_09625 [Streptomyces sp. CB02120-2]